LPITIGEQSVEADGGRLVVLEDEATFRVEDN
jgi:hypothetical protein